MSKKNPNTENMVDPDIAAAWTKKWRETCPDNCKAFLIPAVDLIEVLNEIGLLSDKVAKKAQEKANKKEKDIRAYMAIGSEDGGPEEERLLLVGTRKGVDTETKKVVYRDIINGRVDGKVTTVEAKAASGIYDLTTPCPPYCDSRSILNG